jgi:hypothetical protein
MIKTVRKFEYGGILAVNIIDMTCFTVTIFNPFESAELSRVKLLTEFPIEVD